MKHKGKKSKKQRGSGTHGYGTKKHRGAGNRGGRGMAGTGKRADTKKPTILKKYGNAYFGKSGFRSKHKIETSINLDQLPEGKEINLFELGYDKLLSRGDLKGKIVIRVKKASKKAIEKIQAAGGEIIFEKK